MSIEVLDRIFENKLENRMILKNNFGEFEKENKDSLASQSEE